MPPPVCWFTGETQMRPLAGQVAAWPAMTEPERRTVSARARRALERVKQIREQLGHLMQEPKENRTQEWSLEVDAQGMQMDVARQVCSMQLCRASQRHVADPGSISIFMPYDEARPLMAAFMTSKKQKLRKVLADSDAMGKTGWTPQCNPARLHATLTKQVAFSGHPCRAGCVCPGQKCVLLPQDCDIAHCGEVMNHRDALWHFGEDFMPSSADVRAAGPAGIKVPSHYKYMCIYMHAKVLDAKTGESGWCDLVLGALECARIRSAAYVVTNLPDTPWYDGFLSDETPAKTKTIVTGTFKLFHPSDRITVRVTQGIPRDIKCDLSGRA